MVHGEYRMVVGICRACLGSNLFTGIDLGNIPIAGAFLTEITKESSSVETKMLICSDCGLGQISKDLDPSELYENYNWRTSTSKSYISYIHKFADEHIIPFVKNDEWVLEIASNDGYLLKYLISHGINVLGVDPAKNISLYAICDGVPVVTDFFDKDLASEILRIKGYPKYIIANNVMAHTPNIRSFMHGLSILSNEDTIISIENPSIVNILEKLHFDVIFHEHYSYLSGYAVDKLAKTFGLNLFNTEWVDIQGGSNRYWISKNPESNSRVKDLLSSEISLGLLDEGSWLACQHKIKTNIEIFKDRIQAIAQRGGIVCGFAASAKSTIILNLAEISSKNFLSVADDVLEKQNHFIPGVYIPIVSMEEMLAQNPTDIVVFAWNIFDEIQKKILNHNPSINVWTWNSIK